MKPRKPLPPVGFIGKPRPPANLNGGADITRQLRELDQKFAAARQRVPSVNPYVPKRDSDAVFDKIVKEIAGDGKSRRVTTVLDRTSQPIETIVEESIPFVSDIPYGEDKQPESVYSQPSFLGRLLSWLF